MKKNNFKSTLLEKLTFEIKRKNISNEILPVWSVTNERGLMMSNEYFKKQVFSKNLTNYKIVESKELVYNPSRINVGSIALNESNEKGLLSPMYVIFGCKDELIPKYLLYFLTSDEGIQKIKHFTTGSVRESLNYQGLKKIEIKLPSIEIQQEIIFILNNIQSILEKRKKTIELVEKLIQGNFVELFGNPSELTKIYDSKTFDSIAEIRSGITMSKERREGENKIPYLTVRNLYRERFDLTDLRSINVSKSDLEKWQLQYGDICILEGGDRDDVGRSAVYIDEPEICVHQNHVFCAQVDTKEYNPFFVSSYLNSDYMRSVFFNLAKATTGINSINKTQLSSLKIPKPPIDLQNLFGNTYIQTQKIQNIIKNKYQLEKKFKSNMDMYLFSGRLFN